LALWAALTVAAYWSARIAWADHLSYSASLADRERAVVLVPGWAPLHQRLAERQVDLGQSPSASFARASELEPENPERLERLAQHAEIAGDVELAERTLLAAAARSRLYQPRYLLAQFYFRRRTEAGREAALRWAHKALDVASGDVLPLLDLCWRIDHKFPPSRVEIQRQALTFLVDQHETAAAAGQAQRLSATATAADLRVLLNYIDRALADADTPAALETWNALCRCRLIPEAPLPRGTVTNAAFTHRPLGAGFDWQVPPVSGVNVLYADQGLRLHFAGKQPETCTILWQFVPIAPGAHYRASSTGTSEGLFWELDSVPPSADLTRLRLVYRRPIGAPRFEGTVQLTDIRLERIR
jgi:hypothetical protein